MNTLANVSDISNSLLKNADIEFMWNGEAHHFQNRSFGNEYPSRYEMNEVALLAKILPNIFQSVWVIRPKQEEEEVIEQKPLAEIANNYYDERGDPMPPPWLAEKRDIIEIKKDDIKPSSIKSKRRVITLLNELTRIRKELMKDQMSAAIPFRNNNGELSAIGLLYNSGICNQPNYAISFLQLYCFKHQFDPSIPLHESSKQSMDYFLKATEFYTGYNDTEVELRSQYQLVFHDCILANVSFKWPSRFESLEFLLHPDLATAQANLHLQIKQEGTGWPEDLGEIQRHIKYMESLLKFVEDENYKFKITKNSRVNIETEVDNLLKIGKRKDFTADIWRVGEQLSIKQLTELMSLLLRRIATSGKELVIKENNSSAIALRIMTVQQGQRMSTLRRTSSTEAVELLLECGEIYLGIAFEATSKEFNLISQIANESCPLKTDFGSLIKTLRKRYELTVLDYAIDQIGLADNIKHRAFKNFSSKGKEGLLDLLMTTEEAWGIVTKLHPSVWEISIHDYQFTLQDRAIDEEIKNSKTVLDQYPSYYVIEKVTEALS